MLRAMLADSCLQLRRSSYGSWTNIRSVEQRVRVNAAVVSDFHQSPLSLLCAYCSVRPRSGRQAGVCTYMVSTSSPSDRLSRPHSVKEIVKVVLVWLNRSRLAGLSPHFSLCLDVFEQFIRVDTVQRLFLPLKPSFFLFSEDVVIRIELLELEK